MRILRLLLALSALLASLLLIRAHGYVVRAIPADRSTLERPPTRLQYWFSEALEPRFSEINLRDQSGNIIASGGVDENSLALLSLRVPTGLPDGAYIVELRPAFASDGHVIAESRVFFVGEEVGGVSGRAADDRAIPLKFSGDTCSASRIRCFLVLPLPTPQFYCRHGAAHTIRQEDCRRRVMRRLRNCFVLATAIGIVANLVAIIQQSMVFFNTDASQVFEQGLWQVVQIGSRFGDVWTFRLVLLVFIAVLVLLPNISETLCRRYQRVSGRS